MKKSRSTKGPGAPKTPKATKKRARDPFAVPPHPLGYRFLSEERPIRATRFGAILPTIIAKYGIGRKLGVERFQNAWRDALAAVFTEEIAELGSESPKIALYAQYARPVAFRGGTLSVQIASNLLYQEASFYLPRLLREIQAALPDENVEKIKLIVR